MAFGDQYNTVMMYGAFPVGLEEVGELVEASMLSVVYDPDRQINPWEVVNFDLDLSETDLRFAALMGPNLMFTRRGHMPASSGDKATLIVGNAFYQFPVLDEKQFLVDRLDGLLKEGRINTDQIKEVEFGGISGLEVTAACLDVGSGLPSMAYYCILFENDLFFTILGQIRGEETEKLDEFRRIARTFERKN